MDDEDKSLDPAASGSNAGDTGGTGIAQIEVESDTGASFSRDVLPAIFAVLAASAGVVVLFVLLRWMDIIPPVQPLVKQSAGFALYRAGSFVEEGDHPRYYKNTSIAVKFYMKSAYFGNCASMFSLGRLYAEGSGVPASIEEASYWFLKSANGGNPDAQEKVGDMYYNTAKASARNGTRNPGELVQAYMWYNLAVAGGNSDAQQKRQLVEKNLSPEELDRAQKRSIRWQPEL